MSKKSPWHSINPRLAKKVYHNDTECTEGNNIEPEYLRSGDANRPLCERCAKL